MNIRPATGFSGVLDPRTASAIPAIPAADRFLSAVRIAIATPPGQRVRAKHAGLSVALVLAGAAVELRTADGAGRNIMTSNATLARRLQAAGHRCSTDTAAKVRYILRDLGFQTTVEEGRHLTRTERLRLTLATGKRYWGKAARRVLTMPREYTGTGGICDLLPVRGVSASSSLSNTHQRNARARSRSQKSARTNPPRSRISLTTAMRETQQAPDVPEWSRKMRKLASAVEHALSPRSERNPLPAPGTPHIGHYCRILTRYGIGADYFTAQGVKDLTSAVLQRQGSFGWVAPRTVDNPLAYLRWALKEAQDSGLTAAHIENAQKAREAAQKLREQAQRAAQHPTAADIEARRDTAIRGADLVRAALAVARQ